MPRKSYQLPPGTRYLTPAELEARRAAKKGAKAVDGTVQQAAGEGWAISLPRIRRRRRRRRFRPPPGIWRMPR